MLYNKYKKDNACVAECNNKKRIWLITIDNKICK